jgi:hypothetical protein
VREVRGREDVQLEHPAYGIGIVSVDVEDGGLVGQSNIGAVLVTC